MRTLSAPVLAALESGLVRPVQFLHIDHPAGVIALNTSTYNLEYDGVTYVGAYGLGRISEVIDGPGEMKGLQFELGGVDLASLQMALDELDQWQGSQITVRTAVVSTADFAVLDAPLEWTGKADTIPLSEDGRTAVLLPTAEHSGVRLLRGTVAYYTDDDQQRLYAGDRAFEYVSGQTGQRVIWPSKEWGRV